MRGDDEQTLGGGLGAAIFVMPLVFGWLVLRRGYHPGVRAVVAIYMVLSLIPLYLLASMLWNSGDQISTMARDYDRNRAVADRNAGTAKSYMDQYEQGDLVGTGDQQTKTEQKSAGQPVSVTSQALAKQIEADRNVLASMAGREIRISGRVEGQPKDGRVFLAGGELYPAVILEYAGTPPAEGDMSATCSTIRLETIGPILGGCR